MWAYRTAPHRARWLFHALSHSGSDAESTIVNDVVVVDVVIVVVVAIVAICCCCCCCLLFLFL